MNFTVLSFRADCSSGSISPRNDADGSTSEKIWMGVEDLQIPRILVRKGSPGSHIFLSKDGISKISRDVDGGSASLKIKQGHDDCTKKTQREVTACLHMFTVHSGELT